MCGAGSFGRHGVILAVFRRVHCMLLRILRRALDRRAPFFFFFFFLDDTEVELIIRVGYDHASHLAMVMG
jgi:hypothetical protein